MLALNTFTITDWKIEVTALSFQYFKVADLKTFITTADWYHCIMLPIFKVTVLETLTTTANWRQYITSWLENPDAPVFNRYYKLYLNRRYRPGHYECSFSSSIRSTRNYCSWIKYVNIGLKLPASCFDCTMLNSTPHLHLNIINSKIMKSK